MVKIKAAVLRSGRAPLKIETLEMDDPRDDEILVRISASGICHTDIDIRNSWTAGAAILGHEGAGIVEYAGKKINGVQPGDHVVLTYQSCGRCSQCRTGRPAHCRMFWDLNFGFMRRDGSNALHMSGVSGHFFGQSSFSTHCLATERNVVKVTHDLPLGLLAPLGCGLQTGAGTIMNSLKVQRGSSVVVFGTGAVGLAATMAAKAAGADPIIGVDIRRSRLKLALELGATHTIHNRRHDIASQIARITGGGADYALEITGDSTMHQTAVNILNPGGTVALIANPNGDESLPGGRKIVSIIQGDSVPKRFIPRLISLYKSGKFPFDRLIRFYEFRHINRAITDAGSGKTVKPVLLMPDAM